MSDRGLRQRGRSHHPTTTAAVGIALLACLIGLWAPWSSPALLARQGSLNLSRDLVTLGIASRNMVPNDPTLDAAALFQLGVEYAQSHHLSRVTVDRGSYYFLATRPQQPDRYTNLYSLSNMVIDLAGSTVFFNRSFLQGFSLNVAQNVTLTNFTIDYLNPPYTHAQITSVDTVNRRVFYSTLPGWPDPATFNGLTQPYGPLEYWAVVFRNGKIVPGTNRMEVSTTISSGSLRFVSKTEPWLEPPIFSTLQAGDVVVVTLRGGGPPIQVFWGSSMVISNVTVYGASFEAVLLEQTSDSLVDNVRVLPRPGSGLIGSNTGAIHFTWPGPNNVIRNCHVMRTMDDAIAIEDKYAATVLNRTGPRSLWVRRNWYLRLPNNTSMNFLDPDTPRETTAGVIVSQNPAYTDFPTFNSEVELTFDRDLPSPLPGSVLVHGIPAHRGAGAIIEDNTVEEVIFGQGIWVGGVQGVTVRRNVVRETSNYSLGLWQHSVIENATAGPPVQDIVVDSNVILSGLGPMASGVGTQHALGAIGVGYMDHGFRLARTLLSRNISITSNYVADSGRTGIWVGNVDGGNVTNNRIVRWNRHPELPVWGMLQPDVALAREDFTKPLAVRFSANVNLVNNTTELDSLLEGAVSLQPSTTVLARFASSGSFGVHGNVIGLSWKARSDSPWLTIVGGQSGQADGNVQYAVAENDTGVTRVGAIVIAGMYFRVTEFPTSTVPP